MILRYFFNKNKAATSPAKGKRGVASGINDVKRDLKALHGLAATEVVSNLTYLVSQRWVDRVETATTFTTPRGVSVPQRSFHYQISALGIDKIEGEGEFTMKRFQGINITATGQSIVNVGDGNQVNARFASVGTELAELRKALAGSDKLSDSDKLEVVGDIDSMQAQLAKAAPNKPVVRSLWETVQRAATVAGLVANVGKVAGLLAPILA